jgi:transcriptional regulator with XRE-family HTH domain
MSPAEPDPNANVNPVGTTAVPESLGRRIAGLRNEWGLTQTELAERVAISRVALSNLESNRSVPGERTIVLLSGVFHIDPHVLVAGTDYPLGKAERLPAVSARYTEVDLQIALLDRDLRWLEGAPRGVAARVRGEWSNRLAHLAGVTTDPGESAKLAEARSRL